MDEIQRPSKKTLIRFFKGKSTTWEANLVQIYLALDIDQAYVQQCLQEASADFYANSESTLAISDNDIAWKTFEELKSTRYSYPKPNNFWKYAIAAAIVVCLSITLLLFNRTHLLDKQTEVVALKQHHFMATKGRVNMITLPDSSIVSLFPGASIDFTSNFNESDRRIKLSGKAYFKVKHNPAKPFYVSTDNLTTKVLGTSFQINPAKSNKSYAITLLTGKIAVSYKSAHLGVLLPNQQLNVDSLGKHTLTTVDAAHLTAWTLGELRYEQIPLVEICKELEDWYAVKIKITNKHLLNKRLTANFKREPITTVLEVLSLTGGFKYAIVNQQITIY